MKLTVLGSLLVNCARCSRAGPGTMISGVGFERQFMLDSYGDRNLVPSFTPDTLLQACQEGHTWIVSLILNSPDFVFDSYEKCLIAAIQYSHYEILDLLLQDSRVDPSFSGNRALLYSIRHGNITSVQKLFKHPRIDLYRGGTTKSDVLLSALQCGSDEIAERIMFDPRLGPVHGGNWRLMHSVGANNERSARPLLDDPRVDPTEHDFEALRLAAANGNFGIFQMMLADSRISLAEESVKAALDSLPNALNISSVSEIPSMDFLLACKLSETEKIHTFQVIKPGALRIAVKIAMNNGSMRLLSYLLSQSNISSSLLVEFVKYAASRGYEEAVDLLLERTEEYGELWLKLVEKGVLYSCKFGHLGTVFCLLEKLPKTEPFTEELYLSYLNNALDLCLLFGNFDLFKVLADRFLIVQEHFYTSSEFPVVIERMNQLEFSALAAVFESMRNVQMIVQHAEHTNLTIPFDVKRQIALQLLTF